MWLTKFYEAISKPFNQYEIIKKNIYENIHIFFSHSVYKNIVRRQILKTRFIVILFFVVDFPFSKLLAKVGKLPFQLILILKQHHPTSPKISLRFGVAKASLITECCFWNTSIEIDTFQYFNGSLAIQLLHWWKKKFHVILD